MTLQALRGKVGDKTFFRILRDWYAQNKYGNVTTADFVRLAEKRSRHAAGQLLRRLALPAHQAHQLVVVALVTGAGRGLGAHIACALAAAGHAVAVNDLAPAPAVVAAIRDAGGTAEAYPADVTDEAAVVDLVAAVAAGLGPVDVLVANATGPQPVVGLDELTWEHHLDQLRFFVKSPTLLARAVVPGMKERGGGRIIHIGSDLFERALPGWSAYAAAKGACSA